MASTVSLPHELRADDIFFPAMGLLILSIVVVGFGRTYFFAGMLRAKLPNSLVHIHGALYVSWIFFLTIQPWLSRGSANLESPKERAALSGRQHRHMLYCWIQR